MRASARTAKRNAGEMVRPWCGILGTCDCVRSAQWEARIRAGRVLRQDRSFSPEIDTCDRASEYTRLQTGNALVGGEANS